MSDGGISSASLLRASSVRTDIGLNRAACTYVAASIRRDGRALLFAAFGCGLSATVAVFQFAVFTSFLSAAVVALDHVKADAWVAARGVQCFDFPYPLSDAYGPQLLRFFPGASMRRIGFGFAPWTAHDGESANVAVVAIEGLKADPRTIYADRSDWVRLGLDKSPYGEISGLGVKASKDPVNLATFLGAPYVLADFVDGRRALRFDNDNISFIALDLPGHRASQAALADARAHFPELTILSNARFRLSSQLYWLIKTGAGTAIMLGAILAAVLMFVFLVSGVGRFAQRRRADLMSLLGMGGSPALIRRILLLIGIVIAASGIVGACVMVPILDVLTDGITPWVHAGPVDYLFATIMGVLGCLAGAAACIAEARRFPLAEIFRT